MYRRNSSERAVTGTAPIWAIISKQVEQRPVLCGPVHADLVIIGGGVTGITAAYLCARELPEARIVVVDRGQIGSGATGASTGIITPGFKASVDACRRKFGDQATRAAWYASETGVETLRQIISDESIGCDVRDETHVRVAQTAAQEKVIRRRAESLAELGVSVPLASGTELDRLVGGGYRLGQLFPTAMIVDPLKLVRGIAAAAERLGVTIYESSEVRSVDRARDGGWRVATHWGSVLATSVLFAGNGPSPAGMRSDAASIHTLRCYAMATAPLTDSQYESFDWDGQGAIIDERHFFNHYRLTHDRRLLFGGGPYSVPTLYIGRSAKYAGQAHEALRRDLSAKFPALANIPVAARWSTLESATLDKLPVVGPVQGRDGWYFAGGWSGHGLANGVAAAAATAAHLSARGSVSAPWWRDAAPKIPSTMLRRGVLRAHLRVLQTYEGRETRRLETVGGAQW